MLPRFVSYISNGIYDIGCTGQTVCVYDKHGAELAKFKDLIIYKVVDNSVIE